MKTIHTEIDIEAPADIVWEVVGDLEGWQTWNPVMKASGVLLVGETLTIDLALGGAKPTRLKPVVVHLEEGRELIWQGSVVAAFIFQGEHGFRVTAVDNARSRFEQFETYSGLLAGRLLARDGKKLETGFRAVNRMLKREAEARARARS